MPRISPNLFRLASQIDARLPFLLRESKGNMQQAQTELRWITDELRSPLLVKKACLQRFEHVPLQYILKNQPFGDLEVLTRRGVLIPRWETEEWCLDLIRNVIGPSKEKNMKVADLCSGSGCIVLQIAFSKPDAEVIAVDISSKAVRLIGENVEHNGLQGAKVQVVQADILKAPCEVVPGCRFDLITCNPPYIPENEFVAECTTSVKMYEPRSALIGNLEFYQNLVEYWVKEGRTDSFVYEVGSIEQCNYVMNAIDETVNEKWHVGVKYDSNNQARCVYGYLAEGKKDYHSMFERFKNKSNEFDFIL